MKLIDYLDKYGITRSAFGRRIGKTPEYISRILKGTIFPSRKVARQIEEITEGKVTKEELLFPEDFKPIDFTLHETPHTDHDKLHHLEIRIELLENRISRIEKSIKK